MGVPILLPFICSLEGRGKRNTSGIMIKIPIDSESISEMGKAIYY